MRTLFVLLACVFAFAVVAPTWAADSTQADIDRLRGQAATTVRQISDAANAQIADIQAKIQLARIGAGPAPPVGLAGASFPAPECKEPDPSLLQSARKGGKIYRPLDLRSDELDKEYERHKSCIDAYIQQAFGEIRQIEGAANEEIKRIVDQTNGQVAALAQKAPAADQGPPPALTGSVMSGVEGVTVEGQRLPRSGDTPKGEGDPDMIVCRTPQQRADSRLPGPEICKRNRDWAALYKAGMDISSDGGSLVPTEKIRTTNKARLGCVHGTVGGAYEEHITNEVCY